MANKILFFDQPLSPPGGGQMSLLGLTQTLDHKKYDPTVLLPYTCDYEKMLKKNSIRYVVKPVKSWLSFLRSEKPDLIHCNAATTRRSFWLGVFANMLGIPFVWHVRVQDSAGWKDRVMAFLATKIIVISNVVARKFKFMHADKKLIKVHNGVRMETFQQSHDQSVLREEFGLNAGTKIVGVFSRLDPWKGHSLYLEMAKHVLKEYKDVCFLIVGEGEEKYKQILHEEAKRLGVEEYTIWAGFREDVAALMSMCDVIIHPSIEDEPFGRTIIEAMAASKPMVATNLGGPQEIITHAHDGYLAEAKAEKLANFTVRLLKNEELCKDIGQKAYQKVSQQFTMDVHAQKVQSIYEECLSV